MDQLNEFVKQLNETYTIEFDTIENPLESKETYVSRRVEAALKALQESRSLTAKGINSFKKFPENLPVIKKLRNIKNCDPHLHQLPEEMLSITKEEMRALYAQACHALDGGDLRESLGMFAVLTNLNIANYNYHLGTALACAGLGCTKEAASSFEAALLLTERDAKPYVFAAQFYHSIGEKEKALELLNRGISLLTPEQILLGQKALEIKKTF